MNNPTETFPTFNFDHEPTFAEIWDKCVYLLYDIKDFTSDLEQLYQKLGIHKGSKIIDVAAGAGFPSLDLIKSGFEITCTDGADDMIELFNSKAAEADIISRCRKALWLELPELFSQEQFDLLMCRGISFIYADGGWNRHEMPNPERAIKAYTETLAAFYSRLNKGGWVHLDKFKDEEIGHRIKVSEIKVKESPTEDLVFWTQRDVDSKVRQAAMIRETGENKQLIPNVTYDLTGAELEQMMAEVGFVDIQKISLPSEKLFDIWIGRKP